MSIAAVVHVAGPVVQDVQRCARCGDVLLDNTGALVAPGSPPPRVMDEGEEVARLDLGVTRWTGRRSDPRCPAALCSPSATPASE